MAAGATWILNGAFELLPSLWYKPCRLLVSQLTRVTPCHHLLLQTFNTHDTMVEKAGFQRWSSPSVPSEIVACVLLILILEKSVRCQQHKQFKSEFDSKGLFGLPSVLDSAYSTFLRAASSWEKINSSRSFCGAHGYVFRRAKVTISCCMESDTQYLLERPDALGYQYVTTRP